MQPYLNDPIEHPAHYEAYPVQPISITRHLGFCLGNAVKYVLRSPFKGSGIEDCQKALQYLKWENEARQGPLEKSRFEMTVGSINTLRIFLNDQIINGDDNSHIMRCQENFLHALYIYVNNIQEPAQAGDIGLLHSHYCMKRSLKRLMNCLRMTENESDREDMGPVP